MESRPTSAYISPRQINFLAPADLAPGPVEVHVINNGLTSAMVSATVQSSAPAFFTIGATNSAGNSYIAATHADGSLAGPPNLIAGTTTTPFNPGDIAILYGNGFEGTTSPVPNGQILSTALPLAVTPVVMIGGVPAAVQFAGLSATGEFQFNVVVHRPLAAQVPERPVVIQSRGGQTESNAVITVDVPATQPVPADRQPGSVSSPAGPGGVGFRELPGLDRVSAWEDERSVPAATVCGPDNTAGASVLLRPEIARPHDAAASISPRYGPTPETDVAASSGQTPVARRGLELTSMAIRPSGSP